MKVRLFSGKLLLPFAAFLLLAVSDLSSSSSSRAEDGFWFAHSQSSLEQLWSGVMGCADVASPPPPPPPNQYIRDRLDDDGSSVPTGTSSDYSQCGKLALRNTGSRILVDTIEDAVRSGGVALFNENFHLDSSVGWVWDEKVSGAFDAVVPLFSRERTNGLGYAFFLQPGGVFWQGLKEQDRIDGNLGLAFRSNLTPDVIAGASVFYDHDFRRGHQRAGVGVDLQSGALHTALNYYHPLNDWQEGRTDYEEQPLQGADFRLGLAWSRIRFDTSVAVWRFEREEEESTKWRPAFGIDAGYRILPGVFLEGGYESHDSDDSLDSRWNAGFAFRFSLPGLEGIKSYETMAEANLWEPVAREKRILYEEREAIPPVRLAAPTDESGEELTGLPEEGATITIPGELVALPEAIMLELAIDEEVSSAVLGEDFSYGHAVYELNAETGEQSAPDTVTDCPAATCQMMIPAGVSRFDVEIGIISDTVEREIPEEIVLQVNVPEEYQRMVRGGATTVGIQAHGNTVQFTEATSTLDENGGVTNVEVNANLASPSPITLDVTVTSTDAVLGTDYTIPSGSRLTIPANPDGEITSASLTLDGIDNNVGEGSKTITLTIPDDQSLPTGWTLGTQTTHTVTLQDDDLAIFFTEATRDRVDEPASDQSFTVTVGITQAPSVDIAVVVAAGGTGETASSSNDYTFTATELTFRSGVTTPQTATLTLLADTGTEAEPDEFIVLTLADKDDDATARNTDGFSLDGPHTITIAANDNTVGFASGTAATLGEDGGTATVEVSISNPAPADIVLNITPTGSADEGTDYETLPDSLTIPARGTRGTITLTGIDNDDGEGSKNIILMLSVAGSLPAGWTLGTATHTVILQDDDLNISFVTSGTGAIPSSAEEGTPVDITVGITQAPMAEIKVMVAVDRSASTVQTNDYTLTGAELTFSTSSAAAQTAALMVLQDSVAEAEDETIVLTLSEVSGLTTGGNNFSLGGSYTITIPKNGNTVGFASGTSSFTEGDGTTRVVTVNVNEPAPDNDIMLEVEVLTASSTAREGTDFTIDSKRLTIGRGQSSGTITLRARDDNAGEGNETIMLRIKLAGGTSLPDGWALGTQTTHTVTLHDDDRSIYFITNPSLTPHTPSEVEEPAGASSSIVTNKAVTIAVGITEAPTAELKVRVAAGGTGQTAVPGSSLAEDYVFGGDTLTFPANMITTQTTTLTLVNANENETDETIVLTLDDDSTTETARMAGGFSLGAPHTITIPAHDNTVSFGAERSTLVEGAGMPTMIPVNVEHPAPVGITLDVEVLTAGTAVEGTDYETLPDSLTIPAGELTRPITLTGMDDNRIEGNETIMLRISLPQGSSLPDGWDFGRVTTHEVTLQDDDLRISFADATPSEEEEPASGSTSVTITVDINHAPDADIMVRVAAGGTGETASPSGMNPDYTFAGASLTFSSGSTASQTATLMVRQDSEAEVENETIVLTLAGVGTSLADEGQGFVLGDSHTITIPANGNTVSFASNASTIVEGDSTTGEVEVTVNINEPASEDITLNITTSGTATETGAMADYTIDPKSLTIDAGESSGKITITSNDDDRAEGNETIMLEISEPSGSPWPVGWELGAQTTHEVTLQDDDLRISFVPDTDPSVMPHTPSSVDEPASDQSVTIAVGINHAPTAEIKVMVEADMANSSAVQGTGMDYTFTAAELTFPANMTASQTATLMVLHDDTPEDAETIVLTLTEVSGLTTGGNNFSLGGSYTITIPGNDRTVSFASSAATTLTEGDGTMTEVTVEVTPSAPADIMVDVAVTGTALENTDFTIDSKSLTIPAGETSGKITLRGRDDNTVEGDETIVLEISEPSGSPWPNGWVPGMRTTHTVTLKDDDLSIVFDTGTGNTPNEVEEPASDQTVMVVVDIGRAPTTPVKVTVGVDTVASTAMSGTDYTFTETELTFPVNSDASQSVPLVILHDEDPEDEETIVLTLSDPDDTLATEGSGFMLGAEHTIRIPKNDTRTVGFGFASSSHDEGSTRVRASVALIPGYSDDIKVGVRRLPGSTAIAGTDYTDNIPQTITIPMAPTALASSEFISINVIDDNDDEEEKTLILEIFNPSGADAWPAGFEPGEITVHTFTIQDNDVPEDTIGFDAVRSVTTGDEGDTGVRILLEIAADLPAGGADVNIAVAVSGVSNTSAYVLQEVDQTFGPMPLTNNVVNIAAGSTSLELWLTIPEDNANTTNETITLTLTKGANFPSGWDLGSANSPTTWTIMVEDND